MQIDIVSLSMFRVVHGANRFGDKERRSWADEGSTFSNAKHLEHKWREKKKKRNQFTVNVIRTWNCESGARRENAWDICGKMKFEFTFTFWWKRTHGWRPCKYMASRIESIQPKMEEKEKNVARCLVSSRIKGERWRTNFYFFNISWLCCGRFEGDFSDFIDSIDAQFRSFR